MIAPRLLPLLPALSALLDTANVTRAAARLGISQPRMSARLATLRELLDDPVLVPAGRGRGMVPTPRGLVLRESLAGIVQDLERAVASPGPFDPAGTPHTFRILANDNAASLVSPAVVDLARSAGASAVRFAFLQMQAGSFADRLEAAEADLVIASTALLGTAPTLKRRPLFAAAMLTAQARNHPRGTAPLDLDGFCALDHVVISAEGGFTGSVDGRLAELGRTRRVAASVQGYLLALSLVERTDLVVTLPDRLVRSWGERLDVFATPLDLPSLVLEMAWHPRVQGDPAHAWLRNCLAGSLREAPSERGKNGDAA